MSSHRSAHGRRSSILHDMDHLHHHTSSRKRHHNLHSQRERRQDVGLPPPIEGVGDQRPADERVPGDRRPADQRPAPPAAPADPATTAQPAQATEQVSGSQPSGEENGSAPAGSGSGSGSDSGSGSADSTDLAPPPADPTASSSQSLPPTESSQPSQQPQPPSSTSPSPITPPSAATASSESAASTTSQPSSSMVVPPSSDHRNSAATPVVSVQHITTTINGTPVRILSFSSTTVTETITPHTTVLSQTTFSSSVSRSSSTGASSSSALAESSTTSYGDVQQPTDTRTLAQPSATESSDGGDSGPLSTQEKHIVGGVVGSVAGAAFFVLLILMVLRYKRRRTAQHVQLEDEQEPRGMRGLMPGSGHGNGGGDGSGGGSADPMAERSSVVPAAVGAALAALTGKRRPGTAGTADSTAGGERGFTRVSGRKLQSVLQSGGDGYTDPHSSIGSGTTDYWRGSQAFEPSEGPAPKLALGAPMRPVSGIVNMREGPGRVAVTAQNPFADPEELSPRPSRGPGPFTLGRSMPSQDGSRGSGSRFHERI